MTTSPKPGSTGAARNIRCFFGLALLLMLFVTPVTAQKGTVVSNSASAVLHLRVTVVPVSYVAPQAAIQGNGPVSFNIPLIQRPQEVREETRGISSSLPRNPMDDPTDGILKTLVVLPR